MKCEEWTAIHKTRGPLVKTTFKVVDSNGNKRTEILLVYELLQLFEDSGIEYTQSVIMATSNELWSFTKTGNYINFKRQQ